MFMNLNFLRFVKNALQQWLLCHVKSQFIPENIREGEICPLFYGYRVLDTCQRNALGIAHCPRIKQENLV